ncbi:MAG: DUF3108 domain-containing protein [Planctomycetota bacterium]
MTTHRLRAGLFRFVPLVAILIAGSSPPMSFHTGSAKPRETSPLISGPVPGLTLKYVVRWDGIAAGHATFSFEKSTLDGKDRLHFKAAATSNSMVSMFYKVSDLIETYLDDQGVPLRFEKHLREGKRIKDEVIAFDRDKNRAIYFDTRGETPKILCDMETPADSQDPLSAILFLAKGPLSKNEPARMTVNTDRRNWDLSFELVREERLDLRNIGEMDTLVLKPKAEFDGILLDKAKNVMLWVDRHSRLPVLVEIDIPIGSVTITLWKIDDPVFGPTPPPKKETPPQRRTP